MKKISYSALRSIVSAAVETAKDSTLSGHHIPVYVDGNANLTAGGWVSNNSYDPAQEVLVAIKLWDSEGDERDADEVTDHYVSVAEDNIRTAKEEAAMHPYEVVGLSDYEL